MTDPTPGSVPNPESAVKLAENMTKAFEIYRKIVDLHMKSQMSDPHPWHSDPLNTQPAMTELTRVFMEHPDHVAKSAVNYWDKQAALWLHASQRMFQMTPTAELPELPKASKRFAHPQWSENPVYDYIKNSYLLASDWLEKTVDSLGDMDPRERRKVAFLTRNYVEAMNPANFLGLNPEVLETTQAQDGENLVRGLQMMLEDMERGDGQLLVRHTDMNAFKVGENMAVTEGSVIWENDILQLIQYAPKTKKVEETPLLFVPPWINKYYVLDLNEKKSMMKWLVEQGHTVFIISWVNPDARHGDQTWESYMSDGVSAAIDKVLEETGAKQLNLGSYCIGGTLVGTFMAHLGKEAKKRIASTTFFTAQLEFTDAGELQVFVDEETIKLVDAQMDKGYLPAKSMASAFNSLRAGDLIWSYIVSNYMLGKEPFPFDLLYWNSDSTAMPARVHHFYLEQFYNDNAFTDGRLELFGKRVDIADISGPVYHVATVEDHIAPAPSVYRGAHLMKGADVRFILAGSGHIAGVVNPPALGKYQYWTNPDLSPDNLEEWKAAAKETEGSWWPDWDAWLKKRSKKQVTARAPGKVLGVIEPAPGRYVKARFDERKEEQNG